MLAEQRRTLILEITNRKGSVSITELHQRLDVSRETLRRDITRLAEEGRLTKIHGGALSSSSLEPAFTERMSQNIEGKRAIGRLAAELIPDGVSVILDSGTTTLCMADYLMERRGLTIYTNDLQIAAKLAGLNENRILILGGEVQGTDGAIFGPDASQMLENYHAGFAVVGISAFSPERGLTDYSREAAELRGQMLNHARVSILLADHTKFERQAPVNMTGFEQLDNLVTDLKPGQNTSKAIKKLFRKVHVAGKNAG
ncbi:MAG: DeoR/GlpR transcriptional regulator [Rhodospirillaceae bacterium]|jgi:DeoR family transcriptional regulator, glycerol-3-phosphate regulon repressor|nr:DeoR/GlpR transcriptional regulator [Rhodospirillaceae bacterium]MBT5244709.1 DeoR/GlpR transcriptional regulator [Rhodospirillaceae bacterium]MBT5562450.1 DeoR/GlpR transcriptional regulator [Rhodospirillaceae bacterium]MBT6242088.1 DeoR/GlpR transcriptional regulator [Rhodospirillaceae bacterium]MBT7137263.1 DeoR/GlpR transcriptional regulator [Rhodospirillaceae bacterium]